MKRVFDFNKCDAHQSEALAQRLCGIIQKKICLFNGIKMRTTATIGIAVYPNHGRNLHQLYTKAERVVSYCRKNDIRGYAYFDEKIALTHFAYLINGFFDKLREL